MEHINQLNKWSQQLESASPDSAADMAVAIRLLNHGIEAHEKLEAANQRELELLAVIDAMIEVLVIVDDEYCYSNDDRVTDVLHMAEERRKK